MLTSFTAVFESPLALGGTGLSFTNRSPGVATFDYGDGAAIGSTAVITLTGVQGPAAGAGSSVTAGYQQLTGTVYGFSPEGIPLVDFDGPVTSQHGVWPDFLDVVLPERCEALGLLATAVASEQAQWRGRSPSPITDTTLSPVRAAGRGTHPPGR